MFLMIQQQEFVSKIDRGKPEYKLGLDLLLHIQYGYQAGAFLEVTLVVAVKQLFHGYIQ